MVEGSRQAGTHEIDEKYGRISDLICAEVTPQMIASGTAWLAANEAAINSGQITAANLVARVFAATAYPFASGEINIW